MRLRPAAVLLAVIGIALGTGAVLALREATLSTHQPVGRDSEVVLELQASANDLEGGRTVDDAVEALLLECRLEVDRSELANEELHSVDGRYTAVFRPGLDQTNQRQLRGCIEDWSIEHLKVDVLSITGH